MHKFRPPPSLFRIKGTLNIISSDPLLKEGHTLFTTAPWQPLSDLYRVEDILFFSVHDFYQNLIT